MIEDDNSTVNNASLFSVVTFVLISVLLSFNSSFMSLAMLEARSALNSVFFVVFGLKISSF